MKPTLFLAGALIFCSQAVQGHEIEGTLYLHDEQLPPMARTQIPFDSSFREGTGRTYVLWIAPDGAIAFHIEEARMKEDKAPLTEIWIIRAKERLKLPKEFEKVDVGTKDQIEGVEKLKGAFRVDWGSDSDYTIFLDVKGSKGIYRFKGFLYGGPGNEKI
jgi:hypothetical protein